MPRATRIFVASSLTALATLFIATSARAAITFTPITPPLCPSTTGTFAYHWRVGGGTGVFDLPDDQTCSATAGNPCPHYSNNLLSRRMFVGNRFTDRMTTYLSPGGKTEANYDEIGFNVNGPRLSGTLSSGDYSAFDPTTIATESCGHANCGRVYFRSDISITSQGFSFDAMSICRTGGTINDIVPVVNDNEPAFGYLQGTNDVIFLRFPVPSGSHSGINVHSFQSATNDIDLYAKCNALPSVPSDAQWTADSIDADDFLDINGCEGGSIFVAVHSFSGSGVFRFDRKDHLKVNGHKSLKVGISFAPTATDITNLSNVLNKVARRIYGTSSGRILLGTIDVWKSQCYGPFDCGSFWPGSSCGYCFNNDCAACSNAGNGVGPGGSGIYNSVGCAADTCTGGVTVNGYIENNFIDRARDNFGASRRMTHELGHYFWGLPDEYNGALDVVTCGHTVMGNDLLQPRMNQYCIDSNHNLDSTPGQYGNGPPNSNHKVGASNGQTSSWTPVYGPEDNFDFTLTDFNGVLGNVVIKN